MTAFGGYDCTSIHLDGVDHTFAERPIAHLAWAPVAENRRVPGGAVIEIWVASGGPVRIPAANRAIRGRLFHAGSAPGVLGEELKCASSNGMLRFDPASQGRRRHFYLL